MMLPKSTFVRRYLIVMSVLTLAAVMTSLALRSAVRARSVAASQNGGAADAADPALGQIAGFQLTDQTGSLFGTQDLAGRYYLADFIFTSCAGVCPTMTSAMADVYREFRDYDQLRFVSISVDPATDTPARLAEYAARLGVDSDRWKFLTGDSQVIEQLAQEQFLLGFAGEPVNHSTRFVLVDGSGAIRGFYDGTDAASLELLRADLARYLSDSAPQD